MLCLGSWQPKPLSLLLFLRSLASAICRVNHLLHLKIVHTLYERIVYLIIWGNEINAALGVRFLGSKVLMTN